MRSLLLVIAGIMLALLAFGSYFVWLPDVVSGKEVVVARITVRNGESVELTQTWEGDGYLTRIRHNFPSGLSLYAVGDPDASKAWSARIEHQSNSACVRLLFNKEDWRYFYNSQSLSFDGQWCSAQ